MSHQNRTRGRRGTSDSQRRETARYRPAPFRHIGKIPTLWADYTTGQGVMGNGQRVQPKIGPRRKNPNLQDMLDTAADAGAQRIMFTGRVPAAASASAIAAIRAGILAATLSDSLCR